MKRYLTILVIAMAALMFAACGGSGKAPAADEPVVTQDNNPENEKVVTGKAPSSFDEKCLDAYGNPTMYALTELTGPEVVQLITEQGYEWIDNDAVAEQWSWFERAIQLSEDTAVQYVGFSACDEVAGDYNWERERYDAASGKGDIVAKELTMEVAGYTDGNGVALSDLVNGIFNIEIVDIYYFDSGKSACVVVKDAAGKRYYADFTDVGPGRTSIAIDSEELIISEGETLENLWTALTGQELKQ